MKKHFLLATTISLLFTACYNDPEPCKARTAEEEAPAISAFCQAKNMNTTINADGIYYEILDPGTGNMVTNPLDTVIVSWESKRLDGTIFEKYDTLVRPATNFVPEGLKFGMKSVNSGGHIKLVAPSAQAFGCPYGPLYYDIKLIGVRKYR